MSKTTTTTTAAEAAFKAYTSLPLTVARLKQIDEAADRSDTMNEIEWVGNIPSGELNDLFRFGLVEWCTSDTSFPTEYFELSKKGEAVLAGVKLAEAVADETVTDEEFQEAVDSVLENAKPFQPYHLDEENCKHVVDFVFGGFQAAIKELHGGYNPTDSRNGYATPGTARTALARHYAAAKAGYADDARFVIYRDLNVDRYFFVTHTK